MFSVLSVYVTSRITASRFIFCAMPLFLRGKGRREMNDLLPCFQRGNPECYVDLLEERQLELQMPQLPPSQVMSHMEMTSLLDAAWSTGVLASICPELHPSERFTLRELWILTLVKWNSSQESNTEVSPQATALVSQTFEPPSCPVWNTYLELQIQAMDDGWK